MRLEAVAAAVDPAAPDQVPAGLATAAVTPGSRPVDTHRLSSFWSAVACCAGSAPAGNGGNGRPVVAADEEVAVLRG